MYAANRVRVYPHYMAGYKVRNIIDRWMQIIKALGMHGIRCMQGQTLNKVFVFSICISYVVLFNLINIYFLLV